MFEAMLENTGSLKLIANNDNITYNIYVQLQLQITGFKINTESWHLNKSLIDFSIDDTVEITEYRFADLNLTKLCAEIGGALGLWLGLGVIQLVQEGLGLVRRLQELIFRAKKK